MIDLTTLTDEQLVRFIKAKIRAYEPKKAEIDTAKRYYLGKHDILDKRRMAIGNDGRPVEVLNLPNSRIVDNQYAKAIDQKTGYIFSFAPVFQSEDKTYSEELAKLFDERFVRTLNKIAKDAYGAGIAFGYVKLTEDGQSIDLVKLNSDEIVPCWEDRSHERLQAVIRRYSVETLEDETIKERQMCTLYLPDEVLDYEVREGNYTLVSRQPYLQKGGMGLKWDKLPIVYFKAGEHEQSVLSVAAKTLQDAINTVLSNFQDNMLEDPRNTVLVVKNYGGEDFAQLRQSIASTGIIGVETVDNVSGGVDALNISLNSENYKLMLQILKDKFVENVRALDVKQEKAGATPNELNIKSMYSDIELDANATELEFRASLEYFFGFFKKVKGISDEAKVQTAFKRNIMVNEASTVEMIKNSVGIISKETLVAKHPFVTDATEELEKIKDEEEEAMADLMAGYGGEHKHEDGSGVLAGAGAASGKDKKSDKRETPKGSGGRA